MGGLGLRLVLNQGLPSANVTDLVNKIVVCGLSPFEIGNFLPSLVRIHGVKAQRQQPEATVVGR